MSGSRTATASLLLSLSLLLISSCGPATPILAPSEAGIEIPDYDDSFSTWTRKAKIYGRLESRVIASATYLSPRFLQAMTREYARIYESSADDMHGWHQERMAESKRSEIFFISVSTRDRDWNDLEQANSMWRLYLVTDQGHKISPERVTAVRGRPTVLAHFFPELGHFSVGYWVYFPRYPTARDGEGLPRPVLDPSLSWFKLLLRSPVASVTLTWDLD